MRAAVFHATGEPAAVLRVEDVPDPTPGPDEVLIAVEACAVQPADLMFMRGRYRIRPQLPQVAGLEGTGTVAASGPNVKLAPGTRVAFRSPGTWATYAMVRVDSCYLVPDGIPADAAAQFALNPVTAWALLDETTARAGDWITASAATSAISRLVAGIARGRGIRFIGLGRPGGRDDLEYPVVQAYAGDVAESLLALTEGVAVAAFLDSVGGSVVSAVLPALRQGATIVSYGVLDDSPVAIRNSDLVYRNLTWKGFGIDYWLRANRHRRESMAAELWAAIRDGSMALPVRGHYPLDDVQRAIADAETRNRAGKVLVVP